MYYRLTSRSLFVAATQGREILDDDVLHDDLFLLVGAGIHDDVLPGRDDLRRPGGRGLRPVSLRALWFRPLLDLDVSTNLVQNIKLAEVHAIGSSDRCRAPRLALSGAERERVEAVIKSALEKRPQLPLL